MDSHTGLLTLILDQMGDGVVVADMQGRFTVFNREAERILGIGAIEGGPVEWSRRYGVFHVDRATPYPADELPLAKAIRGEAVNQVELFIRNPCLADGVFVSVTSRPLKNGDGEPIGGIAVFQDVTGRRREAEDLRQAKESAESALSKVKQLSGLLPLSSYCRKVRNDQNYWQKVESYVAQHSEARFSHGICPECYETVAKPDLERFKNKPE